MLQAFEDYCSPKKNIVYERFLVNKRNQQPGEPFEEFLTDVKKLAQTCEFEYLNDQLVRDKLVMGITDMSLQERLLGLVQKNLVCKKLLNTAGQQRH